MYSTLNVLTLTILEYHNFNYLFSKIFKICFNRYKRIKLFQKSTKCPRSFFFDALYTEVDFTHLRESSEITMQLSIYGSNISGYQIEDFLEAC